MAESSLVIEKNDSSVLSTRLSSQNSGSSCWPNLLEDCLDEGNTIKSQILYQIHHQLSYHSIDDNSLPGPHQIPTIIGIEGAITPFYNHSKSPHGQEQSSIMTKEFTPPSPPPPHRRRPGRPRKSQIDTQFSINKYSTNIASNKLRRQMHNDSATRSRTRLNKALDKLWKVVLEQAKTFHPECQIDNKRDVSRAVKVEVAIAHLQRLQAGIHMDSCLEI